MTARAAALRSTLAMALRLDLRSLRLLLAVVALALGVIAAQPDGASAKPAHGGSQTTGGQSAGGSAERTMAQAQKACTDAGGTWTVEGTTAYCKGIGNGGDYSCNLKIGPGACSHLPRFAAARATQGGSTNPAPTPMPTFPKDASAGAATSMSPLDE